MTPILAYIQPWDLIAGARVNVRAADAAQADAYGLGGQEWKAAITERPVMSLELMSPDLDGKVLAGRSRISFNLAQLGLEGRRIKWDGAAATIYSAAVLAWPAVTEFDGYVVEVNEDPDTNLVTLTLQVSTDFLEGPLLVGEFTGGGGLLGEAAARGVLYPAGFGSCENIEPVWFDTTTWIGMIDGYANTVAITRLMEGLDDRGPAVANYANYAALKNAIDTKAIPPGRWGTCIAQGLVGLGAPPVAPIGVNATFTGNRLGAIMQRILSVHRGVPGGNIDAAAFNAMDVAVDRAAHYWTKDQRDVRDLIEAMASNLNATPIVTFQKKVTITRGIAAAATAELIRSGRSTPRVIDSQPAAVQKPVYRLRARVARPANFLTFDQVLYEDTIEDKGLYDNTTVYRSGHLVWMPDKSSWLYTNATPAAGNAPPAWPITSNAYWENMTPPASASDLKYADGTPIENLKPAQAGANVTGTNTAAGIFGQGALATQNNVDWRSQVMARPAIEALYYDFNYADLAAMQAAGWNFVRPLANYALNSYPNSPGGKALVMGTGTGGTALNIDVFGPEFVPYNANDLYEIAFDIEVISGSGTAVIYLGVEGRDRAGNNLGASYNYVAVSGQGQLSIAGQRRIYKGYFTGYTTDSSSGQSNNALAPAAMPDGTAAGLGQGGVVNFRPMALVNYPNTTGQVRVHAIRVTRIPARLATQDEVAFGTVLIKETSGGANATLSNFKTILGTSASIVGQGYLATQNTADWASRVVGTGKPADGAGTSLTLYAQTPADYLIYGNQVEKIGASGWTTCVFSREAFVNGCIITGRFDQTNAMMFGLTDAPGAGDFSVIDYAWYNNYSSATSGVYESGSGQGAVGGGFTGADVFSIEYEGANIIYRKNGVVMRKLAVDPNRKFYAAVAIHGVGAKLSGFNFSAYDDKANTYTSVVKLSLLGTGSQITGNTLRKIGGTHGVNEGGVVGVLLKNTAFVSCSCLYDAGNQGGWVTTIALDPNFPGYSSGTWPADGVWLLFYTANAPNGALALYKRSGGTMVAIGSWSIPGLTYSTRRLALVFNGRRVFAMVDGVVYGGDTAAYNVAPGSAFYPKVLDYHRSDVLSNAQILDGIVDIRYGDWTDVRTYLDDGYTILNQAGFKTDEGTASGILGQGPGATASAVDVLNYNNANATTIIRAPDGGIYSYDTEPVVGCVKISLPVGYTNTMVRMTVDVYNYSGGPQETYIIAGYANAAVSSTNGDWRNVSAQYIGPENRSRRVRFGHDGTKACVWIGETTDTRSYPKVVVRDVMLGYSNQSAATWKAGWAITTTTTAPSNGVQTIYEVTKPRAGDAVFGESIFESASGASAALSNFKTLLGTAAAIIGQGALATLNQVDMSTTQVLPRGSAPPTLANNGFTYTSNTNSITVSWPTMTVYRSDASTISVASGSQAITGLSAGTTYRIYPFIADTGGGSATMDFVTGVSPAFGSPGILYSNSSPNVAAASQMYYYNRIPMGNFALATTSSGGGGGGGGGGWNCLHEDMLLCQRPAGETEEGTAVGTPEHMGCSLAIIARVERHYCSRWIEIYAGEEMIAKVTERHLFYRATDMSPVSARDVRLGDLLRAEGDHVEVTGLRLCTRPATAIGIDIGEPHLHYAGPRRLVCHNGTAKP